VKGDTMKKATILLTGLLAFLICIAPVLGATYSSSFVYTAFNTATASYKTPSSTYETWSCKLTNVLTYNSTIAGTATLRLNATATQNHYIDVAVNSDASVDIWWSDNGTDPVKIGTGSWVKSEAFYISRDSKGYLDFGNATDKDVFISNFVIGDFTLEDLGAKGETDCATAGYISVELGTSSTDPTDMSASILSWMPLVIQFAMLGVVMGMLKKFGKI